MKTCKHCNKELPEIEFRQNRATTDGLQQFCIPCHDETNARTNPRRAVYYAAAGGIAAYSRLSKDERAVVRKAAYKAAGIEVARQIVPVSA